MRQEPGQRGGCRQASMALAVGLPLLAAGTGIAAAEGRQYDLDNQYGAVMIPESEQPRLPMFNRAGSLNAMTVNDIDRTPHQPDGIKVGNYIIFPDVTAKLLKDDRFYGINGGQGEIQRELSSTVTMFSHLPRHLLDFTFSGRAISFQNHDERNFFDGSAQMQGRLDISYGHALIGNFATILNHEDRRDGETPLNVKRAVEVWENSADIGYVHVGGRWTTAIGALADRKEYHATEAFDGTLVPQSFRDTDMYKAYGKLSYQFSPGYTWLTRLAVLLEQNRGSEAFNRGNHGYEAASGLSFELTRLLRVAIEAGYTERDYDQKSIPDFQTFTFDGRLAWLVTPSLTVYLNGQRLLNATGVDGASGRLDMRFGTRFEYEFRRNIVFTGGVDYLDSQFIGVTRRDNAWLFNAGAQYFYNKHTYFSLKFEHDMRTSSSAGASYEGNKITAGISFRH